MKAGRGIILFRLFLLQTAFARSRDQHSDILFVLLIIRTEMADEIAFFIRNCDQHIGRHSKRQQKMSIGHMRRRPERQKEARIEWVADELVEERRSEFGCRRRFPARVKPDLL